MVTSIPFQPCHNCNRSSILDTPSRRSKPSPLRGMSWCAQWCNDAVEGTGACAVECLVGGCNLIGLFRNASKSLYIYTLYMYVHDICVFCCRTCQIIMSYLWFLSISLQLSCLLLIMNHMIDLYIKFNGEYHLGAIVVHSSKVNPQQPPGPKWKRFIVAKEPPTALPRYMSNEKLQRAACSRVSCWNEIFGLVQNGSVGSLLNCIMCRVELPRKKWLCFFEHILEPFGAHGPGVKPL